MEKCIAGEAEGVTCSWPSRISARGLLAWAVLGKLCLMGGEGLLKTRHNSQ